MSRKAEEELKVEKKLCSVGSGSKSLNSRTPRPAVTAKSAIVKCQRQSVGDYRRRGNQTQQTVGNGQASHTKGA